ncbi:hypothetical protein CCACVL1_11613 [Corchorus capsularis]|uniref:Uncharacterized protein n=1 Tax=Corchorus capsularis TaxID=210143 RepID=A0A1R3IK79_COCAP|nr:hypothetical protein CCACVL1_11613 [Corchorus capsularis]
MAYSETKLLSTARQIVNLLPRRREISFDCPF